MEKREPRAKWTSILSNDIYIYDIFSVRVLKWSQDRNSHFPNKYTHAKIEFQLFDITRRKILEDTRI